MKKIPPRSNRFLMILISILVLAIHLNILTPALVHAAEPVTPVGEDVTVLAFTSDVHNSSDNTAANRQSAWIDKLIDKYGRIDAMGFCGDMGSASADESQFWTFTQAVMDVTDQKGITDVYTTGNHEFYNGKYSSTSSTVANNYIVDAEGLTGDNYTIYCLGTDNWNSNTDNYTDEQVTSKKRFPPYRPPVQRPALRKARNVLSAVRYLKLRKPSRLRATVGMKAKLPLNHPVPSPV